MDRHQYEFMVIRLLQNRDWYKKVSDSVVQHTTVRYQKLIGSAYHQGPINKRTWEFLNVSFPRTPTLYALPKIHKNSLNHPGHTNSIRKWLPDGKS